MDKWKEHFKIICDEVNVKRIVLYVATTEKGKLEIEFNSRTNKFNWLLNGDLVESKVLEEQTEEVLGKLVKK